MSQTDPNFEQASPHSYDLTGKRVVVVGGKTGMGLGVAHAARAAGAAVTVASRRATSADERPDLVNFDQIVLDMSDEGAVKTAFEATLTDVLDANRQLLTARDALLETRANAARAAVRTFRSFGGGWENGAMLTPAVPE